jgi:tetratricopeptide (TPR) repeat protein
MVNPPAHLMLGTAKFGVADSLAHAMNSAKAIALNPNLPEVHMPMLTLSVTGSPEESMKEFKAELAVDPYNFQSNLQIGAMLRKDQNYDEAKKYLDRALQTRPGDLAVRYQIAAIEISEGKFDQARAHL